MNTLRTILVVAIASLATYGIVYAANSFPTSLNNWSDGDTIESGWANSLEAKIGIDGSAVTTSIDYLIKNAASILGSIANVTPTDGVFLVADGTKFVGESGATARTSLGVAIGTNVQAFDAFLDDISDLTDVGQDVIPFWDDSAGIVGWLYPGSGITITATSISSSGGSGADSDLIFDTDTLYTSSTANFFTIFGTSSSTPYVGLWNRSASSLTFGTGVSVILAGTTYTDLVGDPSITASNGTLFAVLGTTVEDTELANEDFGDFTCTGGEDGCTIDSGLVFVGQLTGNASTSTQLAANGSNCTAGSAPEGVDALGAVENCTDYEEDLLNEAGLYAALSDVSQFWEAGDTITSGAWNGDVIGLAYGGTGSALSDVNQDVIPFWDDTAGAVGWLYIGNGLTITTTSIAVTNDFGATIDDTELTNEDFGDFTCTGGEDGCTIDVNSVALGTDTTGNYAAGDAEGGAALTGDSATDFFTTGALNLNIGGLGGSITNLTKGTIITGSAASTVSLFQLGSCTNGNALVASSTAPNGIDCVATGGTDTFATVQVNGVATTTAAPTFDFDGADFTVVESPADDVDITIKDSGIDHDATTNFVSDEHIAHSGVTLTAGYGLVGGGTIDASFDFQVASSSNFTWTGQHDFTSASSLLPTSAVDAIGEVSASIRSGADITLITGTKGTNGNCVQWNVDGDVVDAGAACGTGGADSDWQINADTLTATTGIGFVSIGGAGSTASSVYVGLWNVSASSLTFGTGASFTLAGTNFTDLVGDPSITASNGTLYATLGSTIESAEITNDTIVNADINSAAAIAYSKLNLTGSIVENDLTASLVFDDGDLLDFGTFISSATEGLMLPANATTCATATAEGQVCWEEDADTLWVGTGAAAKSFEPGAFDSTAVDDTTWSDNLNVTNTWTFDVSGTDHTLTASSAELIASNKVSANGGDEVLTNQATFIVSTDADTGDYTDLQSAIDALPATGGRIFVKAGTYVVSATITIDTSDTTISGEGEATLFQCNGATVSPCFTTASSINHVIIEDIYIDQTNADEQGIGLNFSDISNSFLRGVRIDSFDTGIRMVDSQNTTFYNMMSEIILFDNVNCLSTGGTQANDNQVDNMRCRPNSGDGDGTGISLNDARGWTFNNLNVEPNTASSITGIDLDATTREIVFVNPWIEANATGVEIHSGATRNSFFGGTVTGNTTDIGDNGTGTMWLNVNETGTNKNEIGTELTMNAVDLVLSGDASDIRHSATLDFYPGGQTSISLRVTEDGSSIELAGAGTTNIDFNDGVTFTTGAVIVADTATFALPDSTTCTADSTGEVCIDKSDTDGAQLVYHDGTNENVLNPRFSKCKTIEKLAAADDNLQIHGWSDPVTIKSYSLHCRGTCTTTASITLFGSLVGTTFTMGQQAATTGTSTLSYQSVTANGALSAGNQLRMSVTNTPSPDATDEYEVCVEGVYDRQ